MSRMNVSPRRRTNRQNWLTYSGAFFSQRYSALDQITPSNVKSLELKWAYQGAVVGPWQASPLVVDGVMYVTQRPNDVVALDAKTGRVFWIYQHVPSPDHKTCCGANNRGLAILGDRLFMATLDARLVAINAKTGRRVWDTPVADFKLQYSTAEVTVAGTAPDFRRLPFEPPPPDRNGQWAAPWTPRLSASARGLSNSDLTGYSARHDRSSHPHSRDPAGHPRRGDAAPRAASAQFHADRGDGLVQRRLSRPQMAGAGGSVGGAPAQRPDSRLL